MLRYSGKRAFLQAVREMNLIGVNKRATTEADGENAIKFVEALGDRKFHQESVKCPKELEITLHDVGLNAVWVAFEHGAIKLTTIDCRRETPSRDARSVYQNVGVDEAVRLIDGFYESVAATPSQAIA